MKKLIVGVVIVLVMIAGGYIVKQAMFPTNLLPASEHPYQVPTFTEADMQQGWYYGGLDQKKPGTPSSWKHGGEGTRSATWYDPVRSDR